MTAPQPEHSTGTRPAPERSSVTLWRSGSRPRWSIRVVDGVSHEAIGRLVEVALEADRLMRAGTS